MVRYLPHKNHYSPLCNSGRPAAFQPPSTLRLSVFRIAGLTLKEVWEIGEVDVINAMHPPGKNLHGFADIKAAVVYEKSLDVAPDNNPPLRADILGWSKRNLSAI